MRQLWFHNLLIMLIPITFLMHQVLCSFTLFPVLLYFFNFIFFFLIISSSTGSTCCPLNCGSLHLVSRFLLNMLCIIHPFGSSSWNVPKLISFEILKGLYLFWSSFFEGLFEWIFLFFFQLHVVPNLQFLRISSFLIVLLLYVFLCFFHRFLSLFLASL